LIGEFKNYFLYGVLVILILLILFYIIGIFYGENSITQLNKMTQEKTYLETKIVNLKEDNKIARMELDSFTNDPEALEGYARSKLNLIKKGEVLIELIPNE
jgi:cell division protein FtsB|tara:strand:- start:166 stop:468 length:303 start_codon:yes stop_codon:yes gene_type:complete